MEESAIDYSVHGKFVESTPEAIADIEKMAEYGIPTFKMFMTYKKEGVMSDDETMLKVFEKAKSVNGLPMVHCESNAIAETNIEKCMEENDLSWVNFAKMQTGALRGGGICQGRLFPGICRKCFAGCTYDKRRGVKYGQTGARKRDYPCMWKQGLTTSLYLMICIKARTVIWLSVHRRCGRQRRRRNYGRA